MHRAVFGSFERFIGILIEHYKGSLPLWLMPTQVMVCGITNQQNNYVEQVTEKLAQSGVRASCDLDSQKISYKIKKYSDIKIPYIVICGREEEESGNISIRKFGQTDTALSDVGSFIKYIREREDCVSSSQR